jgi:hypothetical protein
MAYRTPLGKKKSVAGGWVMDHAPTSGDGSCPPRRVDAVDPVDAHAADFRAHERDERVGRAPDEGDVDRSAVRPTCWGRPVMTVEVRPVFGSTRLTTPA